MTEWITHSSNNDNNTDIASMRQMTLFWNMFAAAEVRYATCHKLVCKRPCRHLNIRDRIKSVGYHPMQSIQKELPMSLIDTLFLRHTRNAYARLLGVEITELRTGYAKAVMQVREPHLNSHGAVHGGVLFTMADIACGNAASTYGIWVATSESDFHYLRAAIHTTYVVAEATELSHDDQFATFNLTITDDQGNVLNTGTFTFAFLGREITIEQ